MGLQPFFSSAWESTDDSKEYETVFNNTRSIALLSLWPEVWRRIGIVVE